LLHSGMRDARHDDEFPCSNIAVPLKDAEWLVTIDLHQFRV